MLSPMHLRMARAALGWSFVEFSERTGIAKNSLVRFEAGQGIHLSTASKIEQTLTEAGITLLHENETHGPGILLPKERRLLQTGNDPAWRKPAKTSSRRGS